MIDIKNDMGKVSFEFSGELLKVSAEFSQICLDGCEKVGKLLEKDGVVPEGQGTASMIADLVTGFALKQADLFNPLDLVVLDEGGKVKQIHTKILEFIDSLVEDCKASKEDCKEEDKAIEIFAKLFGINLDNVGVKVLNIDIQQQPDGDPDEK